MNRADSPGFWSVGDKSETYTEDCGKQLKQYLLRHHEHATSAGIFYDSTMVKLTNPFVHFTKDGRIYPSQHKTLPT